MPAGCSRPPRTSRCGSPWCCSRSASCPRRSRPTQPMFYTYALGWDVADYRGAKIVWHGGAVFGFLTVVVLLPEKNVGFSIQINSEDGQVILGLMYELLDHYLGLPYTDWVARSRRRSSAAIAEALAALSPDRQARAGRPVAAAGALRRHLRRSLVRQHRGHPGGRPAHDRLQVHAAHVRHARALAVRHLRHAPD